MTTGCGSTARTWARGPPLRGDEQGIKTDIGADVDEDEGRALGDACDR